ncbi:MAG: radical SAM protein [Candidatus Brocadiaceae bacterium]|nr:radical SAM protein [Candidatus Brocadiaceae bacterium]
MPESTDKILPPVHIRIKPTNACAHNCWYCAYKADNLQLGKDMSRKDYIPKEKMLEIIDDVVDMGVKAITFSGGGDPFYYPYLLETVTQLSGSPVKFASLTNGSQLRGQLAEIFSRHATWIRISIDGWDDESYSAYRRIPTGEFTKVMNNIKNFKKMNGKCFLGISLVVDKQNAFHLYNFIKRLKDIGVDSVKVSPCIVSNNGIENNAYHQSIFNAVKEHITKAMNDLAEKSFEIFDAYHELDEKFEKDYSWCPYLQILPVIGADLNIYPCQDKAYNIGEGLIGSIQHTRFKDFWFSDKNKYFAINPSKVCNNHCVANAKNRLVLDYLNADRHHMEFV